jgi:AraC-like DNA-binding protein
MSELPLFDFVRTHTHRGREPDTSKEAAQSVSEVAARQARIVFDILRQHAPKPLASEQIAPLCEMTPLQVSRRLSDLFGAGMIEESREKHLNRSRRKATRWAIVSKQGG